MKACILFFGATADIAATRKIDVEVEESASSRTVFKQLIDKYPDLAKHRLHYSINQQYATGDEIIRDGDEIAIFTAVSGG